MSAIEIFTWGYWGWGNETKNLIKSVDAVEAKRGFKPPLFVDIRIRRTVRAKGFTENTFGDRVGSDRYRWLQRLGNAAVLTGEPEMRIQDPSAAEGLLDIAIQAASEKRRILFFCACEFPLYCHRKKVGGLLLARAKRREVSLVLDEWPGGKPQTLSVSVGEGLLKQVLKGRKSVPLGTSSEYAALGGLPPGSPVEIHSGEERVWIVSGPVMRSSDKWCLPVLGETAFATEEAALKAGRGYRRERGYGPRTTG